MYEGPKSNIYFMHAVILAVQETNTPKFYQKKGNFIYSWLLKMYAEWILLYIGASIRNCFHLSI